MNKLILTQEQKQALNAGFEKTFGGQPARYFSAPGRTELSGNHTDHQHGRVLAGAVTLALCHQYLAGRGGYRVHGGDFAGTVQAFVPFDILEDFRKGIDSVLGEGACHVLSIRPHSGVEAQ